MRESDYELLNEFIKNDSLDLVTLTKRFKVSQKTILNRIHDLNDSLRDIAEIRNNSQRFYLKVQDFRKLTTLQTDFLKQSLNFNNSVKRRAVILKELILSHDFITLDDLCDLVSVSKGTMNHDLKQIKTIIKDYQAQIVSTTNKGIRLEVKNNYAYGLLLTNLVYDYCRLDDSLFTTSTQSQLQQLLSKIDSTNRTLAKIKANIIILKTLIQADIRMESPICGYTDLLDWDKLAALLQLIQRLLGITLTVPERQFLFYPLIIKANVAIDKQKLQDCLTKLRKVFQSVAQSIKSEIDVPVNFQRVFEQIKYHLIFLINRSLFKVKVDDVLSDEIVEKYPIALELAMLTNRTLAKELNMQISETEDNYLAIYYQMELNSDSAEDRIKKAAIVGHVSLGIRKFITQQLNELFQETIKVDYFGNINDFQANQSDYLIVFSERPIKTEQKAMPVVRINNIFRTDELLSKILIAQFYKEIMLGNCQFQVVRLDAKLGYLPALEALIQTEIQNGVLTTSFLESWQQKEQQTNNVFENGIAIPHVIDDSNRQNIFLRIGIFNSEVTYQNSQVRLVFLIGIPSKLNKTLNRTISTLYDAIATISQHKSIYQNLLDYDSQQPFTQITEGI